MNRLSPATLLGALALVLPLGPAPAGVNPRNGNFHVVYTDHAFAPDLALVRTYNSKSVAQGMFGFGWGVPYEHALQRTATGALEWTGHGGGGTFTFLPAPAEGDGVERWVMEPNGTAEYDGEAYTVRMGATAYRFDRFGRLLAETEGGEPVFALAHAAGAPARATYRGGHALELEVSAAGMLLSARNPADGATSRYEYSLSGNLILSVDVGGNRYEHRYDGDHNMTGIHYADGRAVQVEYDGRMFARRVVDRDGCATAYHYGSDGRAPDDHYWTWVRGACPDGRVTANRLHQYQLRAAARGGRVTTTWELPADYRGGPLPGPARFTRMLGNAAGQLLGTEQGEAPLPAGIRLPPAGE